ncbi:hypothetical protein A1A1_03952 [Planococcus antarcticus DSM 14505]|uniref:Uncharacterized protein n=1 Tax=Planococcus antarcticus DSM 14505 TaxID=1185653 RepID=A0A1C7DGW3_9BACL|nr:hypothetical protein [Planococcus antarcticus]ANU10501.1 hypothetical protein BBH88_09375 [Planococcus antarcticus DSM 14505]EIM07759.1 hypothetical protein A1A1_03952 [Planococcus antarcticus DSM 14505]
MQLARQDVAPAPSSQAPAGSPGCRFTAPAGQALNKESSGNGFAAGAHLRRLALFLLSILE